MQGGTLQAAPVYPPAHLHAPPEVRASVDPAVKQQVGGDVWGIADEYPWMHVHELAATATEGALVFDPGDILFAGHVVPQFAP